MISGLCPTRGEGSFAGRYDIAMVGISRQCPVLCFAPVSAPQRYLYLGWDTRYTNEGKAYFDVAMSGSSADTKRGRSMKLWTLIARVLLRR